MEFDPNVIYDLSGIPDDEKDKMIRGFSEIASAQALKLFTMLGLKTHFETMIINDANGEEFILSFKKVIK